ncbi:DUF3793 family protein [Hathewaya limosa]|uniref:DUF3793 family protein n=1 Tax=Hathewaya limosa TaxID=1536 RepID=A0ABU0JRZ0_HATLI|nr:DUF3793 family protein [Hathewaya limosa]MDQ0479833.1 hypothetical protein [Hathewaya limosa]
MCKDSMCKYFKMINEFQDEEYFYGLLAYSIAPTIFREKPSSLIVFNNGERKLLKIWDEAKEKVCNFFNIKYFELHRYEKGAIVLFYKEDLLRKTLANRENAVFMNENGYRRQWSLNNKLYLLRNRYKNGCPHEIGIFLGYPVKDVESFINCPNKKCLVCGYWKVYNDLEKAEETFNRFNTRKEKVISLIMSGIHPTKILQYCNP